jgi:hypothetical protein
VQIVLHGGPFYIELVIPYSRTYTNIRDNQVLSLKTEGFDDPLISAADVF